MNKTPAFRILYHVSFMILPALPVAVSAQNSYQAELGAEYEKREFATVAEYRITLLGAEIFFDPVKTGSHPYAEAAFLEHAGSLSIDYFDAELAQGSTTDDETDVLLSATIVPDSSPLILDVAYGSGDADVNSQGASTDISFIGFGVGTYIDDKTAIVFDHVRAEADYFFPAATPVTITLSATTITYKHVENLGGTTAYNAEISVTSFESKTSTTSETNTIVELEGDYYMDPATSIGASFELNSGDDAFNEGIALGIDFRIFLTPMFSLSAEYIQFSADNTSGEDADTIILGAAARF